MKFLVDECIDESVVDILRGYGYNVEYIAEIAPSISDEEIAELANRESAIILTADKGFGEIVFRRHLPICGVILIRLDGLSEHDKAKRVSTVIQNFTNQLWQSFTVIEDKKVRIRPKNRERSIVYKI